MTKMPKIPNSTVSKYPRKHASLDTYWVGKDQFVADGVSTDPEMLVNEPKAGATRGPAKTKPSVPDNTITG